jgi:transposase-like protein
MTSPKKRRRFLPEDKLALLKRHFVGKEEVSDICDEESLHPNQFYRWQSELFTNGGKAFVASNSQSKRLRERKIIEKERESFKKLIDKKDEVIAEITEDYVRLKKNSSVLYQATGLSRINAME